MTSFASHISAFALAASAVTAAQAGPQDDCLRPLAKEWDKGATYIGARTTIMGSISMAFHVPQGIVVVNSEMSSAYMYDGDESPITADHINVIGTLTERRPTRSLPLTDAQRKLQSKIAACLNLDQ